jgi:hypothetical protein
MIHVPRQQHLTSISQTALDGAVHPLGTCPGFKMISSSRQLYTGISWMLLSVRQPKPQNFKTFQIDVILWCVSMAVGNKAYTFDIHNWSFSTLEEDTACHGPPPPECQFNFVPMPCLKAFTIKYKSYKKITKSPLPQQANSTPPPNPPSKLTEQYWLLRWQQLIITLFVSVFL